VSDRALVAEQYRTADNLRARIALHERFSTSTVAYPEWVFKGYDFGDSADVLEVGCGDGMIWRENRDRIPRGWRLTLTDASAAMVDEARAALGDRATYAVVEVEHLPFDDATFDAVIANHMLFHVEDRSRALGEIARVLRPGGRFHGTTIGREHLRELRELAPPRPGTQWAETRRRFTIETAPDELAPFFVDIDLERYPDSLEVTELEPLLDFVRSRGDVADEQLRAVERTAAAAIEQHGSFHVAKETARVRARKPQH
jgi:SAM-dependent methyltransferase